MCTPQRKEFEPADKPVRFYETVLCAVAQVLLFAALRSHNGTAELAATASAAMLIVVCLWRLLVAPRFSSTRGAFVVIGLGCLLLLFTP